MKLTKTQLKRIIKEELGRDAVTYYALIEVPYETSLILKESSLEELKAEIALTTYGLLRRTCAGNIYC
jgi:predicted AAA+ superfamily ATPase